jgi:hypothetical protein
MLYLKSKRVVLQITNNPFSHFVEVKNTPFSQFVQNFFPCCDLKACNSITVVDLVFLERNKRKRMEARRVITKRKKELTEPPQKTYYANAMLREVSSDVQKTYYVNAMLREVSRIAQET